MQSVINFCDFILHNIHVGGHDGLSIFNTVERYDPKEKVWTMVTPMHNRRCRVGVTSTNGKLYRYVCCFYSLYSSF